MSNYHQNHQQSVASAMQFTFYIAGFVCLNLLIFALISRKLILRALDALITATSCYIISGFVAKMMTIEAIVVSHLLACCILYILLRFGTFFHFLVLDTFVFQFCTATIMFLTGTLLFQLSICTHAMDRLVLVIFGILLIFYGLFWLFCLFDLSLPLRWSTTVQEEEEKNKTEPSVDVANDTEEEKSEEVTESVGKEENMAEEEIDEYSKVEDSAENTGQEEKTIEERQKGGSAGSTEEEENSAEEEDSVEVEDSKDVEFVEPQEEKSEKNSEAEESAEQQEEDSVEVEESAKAEKVDVSAVDIEEEEKSVESESEEDSAEEESDEDTEAEESVAKYTEKKEECYKDYVILPPPSLSPQLVELEQHWCIDNFLQLSNTHLDSKEFGTERARFILRIHPRGINQNSKCISLRLHLEHLEMGNVSKVRLGLICSLLDDNGIQRNIKGKNAKVEAGGSCGWNCFVAQNSVIGEMDEDTVLQDGRLTVYAKIWFHL